MFRYFFLKMFGFYTEGHQQVNQKAKLGIRATPLSLSFSVLPSSHTNNYLKMKKEPTENCGVPREKRHCKPLTATKKSTNIP